MAKTTAIPSVDDVESGDVIKYNTDYKELSLRDLKETLPKRIAAKIDQEFVDNFNKTIKDPEYREQIKANYIGYISIVQEGRYKVEDYLNAVKFCTYILAGYQNKEAYYLAFPERVKRFSRDKLTEKDIQNLVNGYKRGKLVKTILQQSVTPSWIINQDIYQDAINVQVKLMHSSKSDMVRQAAAACLINELSAPKEAKFQLSMTSDTKDELSALANAVRELSTASKDALEKGVVNLKDIAHSQIVDGEYTEV